jgi:hypothetical protein
MAASLQARNGAVAFGTTVTSGRYHDHPPLCELQEKDVIEVRCRVAQSSYGDSREPSSNVSRRDGKQVPPE